MRCHGGERTVDSAHAKSGPGKHKLWTCQASPGMAGVFRKPTLAFSLLAGACGCQEGLQVFETMGEALKGTVTFCPWHERLSVFFERWAESVAHARVSSIT